MVYLGLPIKNCDFPSPSHHFYGLKKSDLPMAGLVGGWEVVPFLLVSQVIVSSRTLPGDPPEMSIF